MPDWSLEEDVVLFAWLDFCNKHGVDHLATIEQKLTEGTGNRRTKNAARWRLQLIEWKYRQPDETRPLSRDEFDLVPNISQKGSKSLKYPPRAMTRKIKNALSDYEKMYTSNEIQKMVKVTPMKNNRCQLQVQVPSRKSSPVKTRIVPASKTSQQARDEAGDFRKRSSQEAGEEIARKKRRLEKATRSTPLEKQGGKSEMGNPQPFPTPKRAKSHLPKEKPPTKAAISNVHKEPEISLLSETPSEDGRNDEIVEERHHKHTKLELEAKASNLEAAAIAVRNAGRDTLAYEIGQKNREIWMLTNKIHRQFEVSSVKEREAKHLPPQTLDTAMNEICLELEAMTEMQDFGRMQSPKEWFDGDLIYLVNSAFASLEGSNDGKLQLERFAVKLGPSAVFRILALAALRDWVFLTDFPHIESGSLSLIEAYRNIAFNKGGWVELRCFDFGAFKEHMKQPYFKDVLRRTAKQMSCRLSRTLSSLFGKSLENMGHDFSFHTWGEDTESWKEGQYHFERLFCIALELKSDSTPSSCTDDIDLGNQEIFSLERWCLTGECDTTDVVFESPRLIPERRESQLYLVKTEDEKTEENEADEGHSVEVNDTENVNAEKAENADAVEDESTEMDENEDDEIDFYGSIEANHDYNLQIREDERHGVDNEDAVQVHNNEGIGDAVGGTVEAGNDGSNGVVISEIDEAKNDNSNEIMDIVEVQGGRGTEDATSEITEADNDKNDGVTGKEATRGKKGKSDKAIDRATTETENCDSDEVAINRYVEVENEENVEDHDNEILEKWIISCKGPIDATTEVERDETIEFDDNGNGQPRVEEEVTMDESIGGCGDKTMVAENDHSIEVTGNEDNEAENQKSFDVDNQKILEESRLKFDVAAEIPVETENEDSIQLNDKGKLQVPEIGKKEVAIEEGIEGVDKDIPMNDCPECFYGDKTAIAEDDDGIEVDEKRNLQWREVVAENEGNVEGDYNEYLRVQNIEENEISIDDSIGQYLEKNVEEESNVSIEVDKKMNFQELEVEEKVVHGDLIIVVKRPEYGPVPEFEHEGLNMNESMEIDSDNTAKAENDDSKMTHQDGGVHDNQTTVVENDGNIDADYLEYSPVKEVKQGRDTMNEDIEVDSDETAERENEKSISASDKPIDTQEERQNSRTIQSDNEFKDPFSGLDEVQGPGSKSGNEGVSAGSFPWNILGNPNIFSLRKSQQQDRGVD
ncbi:hypothetical protein EAF04_007376 [Stromatinia cepivora]|nr:hypothetical protein EAF04_007376 [Stromatinia cepivora]